MSTDTVIAPRPVRQTGRLADDRTHETAPDWLWQEGLFGPVGDFLNRNGKRIRGELVELSFQMAGGDGVVPSQLVEFIELIHAGSLVIDDIEDGSEQRRGHPSLHRTAGLPVALNAGNWMYFSALEKLTNLPTDAATSAEIMRTTLTTIRRCHEGQAIDLAARADQLPQADVLPTVRTIAQLKTGGLTSLAARLGAMLAGASASTCDVLTDFGMQLGIGLQMQNDLTELLSCRAPGGRSDDLRNHRVTWPWAWLSTRCSSYEFHCRQRLLSDESVPDQHVSECLLEAVSETGTAVVHRQMKRAVSTLEPEFPAESLDAVKRIVSALEHRYV